MKDGFLLLGYGLILILYFPLQRVEISNSISNSKDVIVASDRNNIASNDKSHFRDSHVRPDTISEPHRVFTPYKNQFPCYPESKGGKW